jgi:hypothetical protein
MLRERGLTELDRRSLAMLVDGDWHLAPPCFRPNPLCFGQQARGLLQLTTHQGRWLIRITPLGAALMACRGEA